MPQSRPWRRRRQRFRRRYPTATPTTETNPDTESNQRPVMDTNATSHPFPKVAPSSVTHKKLLKRI